MFVELKEKTLGGRYSPEIKGAMPELFDLPQEILIKIACNLDKNTRCRFRLTCSYLRDIADDRKVWHDKCINLLHVDKYTEPMWRTLETRQVKSVHIGPFVRPTHVRVLVTTMTPVQSAPRELRIPACSSAIDL